jgi:bacteriocin-like protein
MSSRQPQPSAQGDCAEISSDELQQISGGLVLLLKNPALYCVQGIPRELLRNLSLEQAINPVTNQGAAGLATRTGGFAR